MLNNTKHLEDRACSVPMTAANTAPLQGCTTDTSVKFIRAGGQSSLSALATRLLAFVLGDAGGDLHAAQAADVLRDAAIEGFGNPLAVFGSL